VYQKYQKERRVEENLRDQQAIWQRQKKYIGRNENKVRG
jgi:hypothetical protein